MGDINFFALYTYEFLAKGHVFSHIPTEDAPEATHIAYISLQGMQWKSEPAVYLY